MCKMISSSTFHFILFVFAIVYQSQCEENIQQNSNTNYWKLKDSLTCYTTVTLELFENLKKLIEVSYVELGEADFKRKFGTETDFFPFKNKSDGINQDLYTNKINEIETAAIKAIVFIRRWLENHCSPEIPKQMKEIIKNFNEGKAKCVGTPLYLLATWWLEHSCQEQQNKRYEKEKREMQTRWKNQTIQFRYR